MAYIPALNTVKVVLEQLFGAQTMANIFYFAKETAWSESAMLDLLADMFTWWGDNIAPELNEAVGLIGGTVTDMTTSTAPSLELPQVPAILGEFTGPASPTNVAIVVTFRTAGRGRSSRGRNYIGGIDVDAVVSPTDIGSSAAADLVTAYGLLSGVESANSCTHVVASFHHDKAPRTTALLQPITAYTCDTAIDSQRRRLRLRGD